MSWKSRRIKAMRKKNHDSLHHRKPRSLGGKTTRENTVFLTKSKHEAWHTLFSNMTPYEIANEINKFYLDPDFFMVAVNRKD
jgi:5-methylcytosine-specific restriction endonuclease McrA